MKLETRQVIEAVSVLAVVISLALVWYELRQSRAVAVNDSFGTSIETTTDILAFLGDNSSVLRRGCLDEELGDDEELLFTTLVRSIDRTHFFRFRRAQNGITNYPLLSGPNWVARHRIWYPGFDRKWLELWDQSDRAAGDFYFIVEEQYNILKENYSPGQYDASLCGISGI